MDVRFCMAIDRFLAAENAKVAKEGREEL